MTEKAKNLALTAVFAALALAGLSLIAYSTGIYGSGTTPDCAHYISAALSCAAGKGYLTLHGTPLLNWPPLYPTLLALFGLYGLTPLSAANIVNTAAFGGLVFLSGHYLFKRLQSPALRITGALWVLLSFPLHEVAIMAWSESLFALLITLFLIFLLRFLEENTWPTLLALSACAALAAMQRYAGVVLFAVGFLAILAMSRESTAKARVKYALSFAGIATTPLALWLTRNYLATSTLAGTRAPSQTSLAANLHLTWTTLSHWFVPEPVPPWLALIPLLVIAGICFQFVATRIRNGVPDEALKEPETRASRRVLIATAFLVLTYIGFIIATSTRIAIDPISNRFLAPVYVPLLFLILLALDAVQLRLRRAGTQQPVRRILGVTLIALCLLWLYLPGSVVTQRARYSHSNGVPGFTDRSWMESRLVQWLRENPLDNGRVFSNAPTAMYILGLKPRADFVPHDEASNKTLTEALNADSPAYIVWFNRNINPWLGQLNRQAMQSVRKLYEFEDGTVYIFP